MIDPKNSNKKFSKSGIKLNYYLNYSTLYKIALINNPNNSNIDEILNQSRKRTESILKSGKFIIFFIFNNLILKGEQIIH